MIVNFRRITALIVELILDKTSASSVIDSSFESCTSNEIYLCLQRPVGSPGPVSILALTYQVDVRVLA